MSGQFDRLRPRNATPDPAPPPAPVPAPGSALSADREGKRALFSPEVPPVGAPLVGAVTVACSACAATTVLTPRQALFAVLPGLHLPLLRPDYPSWMRCPACRRRTWVRVGLRW
jgi:hypothetical protein